MAGGVPTTQIDGTVPGTGTGAFTTLAFANRNFVTLDNSNPGDTITVDTQSAAPGLVGLTVNAAANGNSLSPQLIYVARTAAGVTTTINAANGWHNIFVGLPAGNALELPAMPLDKILGPVTVSGQDYQDNLTLYDIASTAPKTYTLNSNSITAGPASGVTPAPISWQGFLSVVALFGSTAADTYLLQGLPTGVAALVADGAWTANTVQSLVPDDLTWLVYPNGAVSTGTPGHAVNFSEVWNLTGGPGADTFRFLPSAGQDGALGGVLDGGGGTNTLDYSQDASPVTVNLTDHSATNLDGGAPGGSANIQNVIGNGSSTTLVGPAALTYWNLSSSDQGNLAPAANQPGTFTFTAVPNLTGGPGNDVFRFGSGAAVTGLLDGGGGTNTLEYSAFAGAVTVDLTGQNTTANPGDPFGGLGLATGTAHVRHMQNVVGTPFNDALTGDDEANVFMPNGGLDVVCGSGGDDTVRLWGPQDPRTIIDGGAGTNTLWAADFANAWTVTRPNAGSVRGTIPGFVSGAGFSNFQNLLGGADTDTFRFADGTGVDGWVNGNLGSIPWITARTPRRSRSTWRRTARGARP
jgi:hypothetical protein